MFASILSSFSGWDWFSIIGPALVVAGLAGELWLIYENSPFNPNRPPPISVKHFKIERRSVVLVAIGVAIELATVPHSLMEVATLNREVQEIRAKNDALELKAQDRTIKPTQIETFKRILKDTQKGPIMIGTRHADQETTRYASDILNLLKDDGFTIQSFLNYPNNILPFMPGTSVGVVIPSLTNIPPYADPLAKAFRDSGIPISVFINPDANIFGNSGMFGGPPPPGSSLPEHKRVKCSIHKSLERSKLVSLKSLEVVYGQNLRYLYTSDSN